MLVTFEGIKGGGMSLSNQALAILDYMKTNKIVKEDKHGRKQNILFKKEK